MARLASAKLRSRFVAAARGVNRDLDVFLDALLPDVFLEPPRTYADVDARVFFIRDAGNDSLRLLLLHHPFCACIHHHILNTECTENTGEEIAFLQSPFPP